MIWNFCIARPVLTLVVFLAIAIFGVYGYLQMPLRENPDVEFPIVSVNVVLRGAEPEVVESEVLEPLEEVINTVEGLKELRSTAREQVGTITAEFELWRDIDIAVQDVRAAIDRARRELPEAAEAPIVRKLDPDAQAIFWIALTGDARWDAVRLTRYADEQIKEQLESLRGAGRIRIGGQRRYAVRVKLDPAKLAAHRVTVDDVIATIRRNNVDIPTGRVESRDTEFLVKVEGQFRSAEPFNELIITERDGAVVRIGDVGRAVAAVENDRQTARFQQELSVGLGVVKQSDANTVALAESIRQRMDELAKDFPPGLTYSIAADDSQYIRESINSLLLTIAIATALVVLVILVFLQSGWGTVIAGVAIPTSLLGGITFMHVMGFSVNNLTMLGLILAIGIVIDDAVVVLESVFRHLEEGADPIPAASVGTTEVAFPAVANTLSLSAVFIPVAFTAGLIGRFFYEFGLTVAATVFASTFTALTLTPVLSSRLLRRKGEASRPGRWLERGLGGLDAAYRSILGAAFRHRWITLLLSLAALGLGAAAFTQLSTEFSPSVDREQFIISFEVPEGSTLRRTDQFSRQIEDVLADTPAVRNFFMAIGLSRGGGPGKVNEGIIFVRLTPREQRTRHQSQIVQDLRKRLGKLPGGRVYLIELSATAVMVAADVQLVLQHPEIEALAQRQEKVMQWMRKQPELTDVRSDLQLNKPQVRAEIRRDKASQMGVTVLAISRTLQYLLGEPEISEVEQGSERYEVIPEVASAGEMLPERIGGLYVRAASGELVSLDNLVRLEETIGPSEIHHFNRIRSATISASTPPGVALGDALSRLESHLNDTLPGAFRYEFTGPTQDFQESFYYLSITIGFAVAFIYLVLSAQFESFLQPLVILLTLPLAAVGAFGALYLLDMPFGIFAFIGLIMLAGMATKNAILMIDYTNVLIARGSGVVEATRQAAHVRFRPVIMTTISTVLGLLPIALGFGAGGEARAPMGVAVAAGLSATTLLTLVVIPLVYSLFRREPRPSNHEDDPSR
jgi:hydrophobe/amphiphile efflux-1 (HAE1) family protein